MKKLLLCIPVLAITASVNAQNFTINDGTSNIQGTTVSYNVANNVTDTRTYTVTNVSAGSLTVKVKKVNEALNDPGASTYFCTDQNCYSPAATYSMNVAMNANGSFVLSCDFDPNQQPGLTTVRYTVIDQANNADSVNFVINYNSQPTGIASVVNIKPTVSEPMPNPAASSFSMKYQLGTTPVNKTKFVIYNMLGSVVKESEVEETEGVLKMDVSELESGIYFCSLVSDGKTMATKRLVVSH
ncbi:MAG TPA: T9SS type A sorting domain-containing protein [Bacteroidia bacterium]|jgi:hypothetical protein|nr:T9SS type A sorting domain-containing protein [Bacteroidia bacterium]